MDDGLDPSDSVGNEKEMRRLLRYLLDKVDSLEIPDVPVYTGWEFLGGTALVDVPGDTMSIFSVPTRKYLKVLVSCVPDGSVTARMQFNGDTGANYASYTVTNGGTYSGYTSQTSVAVDVDANAVQKFATVDIVNIANQAKLLNVFINSENAVGAGSAPAIRTTAGKWHNTVEPIDTVTVVNTAGVFGVGSELRVFGLPDL